MRFPWFKARPSPAAQPDGEIEANRRDIEALKPIVAEAVRRTNESFIAVEELTSSARLTVEQALLRDLDEGLGGHG